MSRLALLNNDAIICDTLGCAPDQTYISDATGLQVSRWRQFIGSYELPSLPQPLYVAHVGGKSNVKMWDQGAWTDSGSKPSDATMLPGGLRSKWRVDGELDVVTVSKLTDVQADMNKDSLRFAYTDPLGIALIRQVLAVLYDEHTAERDGYLEALMVALRAHLQYGNQTNSGDIPRTLSSAHRLHGVLATIRKDPGQELSIEYLAAEAGLAPSHFSRMFHRAMGVTPHQYVMRVRIERAEHLLSQSDLSVATIAESLGFKTQAHFTRVFRERTGETPSGYRSRYRERKTAKE